MDVVNVTFHKQKSFRFNLEAFTIAYNLFTTLDALIYKRSDLKGVF